MHVEGGVRDLDLAGEQEHRFHHQQDRPEKQEAGHQPFIEICLDHRAERQNKGNGGTGLDYADQTQPVPKAFGLQREPFGVIRRHIVPDHMVIKLCHEDAGSGSPESFSGCRN